MKCGGQLPRPDDKGFSTCGYCTTINHYEMPVEGIKSVTFVTLQKGGVNNIGGTITAGGDVVSGDKITTGVPAVGHSMQADVKRELRSTRHSSTDSKEDISGNGAGINIPAGADIKIGQGDVTGGRRTVVPGSIKTEKESTRATSPLSAAEKQAKSLEFAKWMAGEVKAGRSLNPALINAKKQELGLL